MNNINKLEVTGGMDDDKQLTRKLSECYTVYMYYLLYCNIGHMLARSNSC